MRPNLITRLKEEWNNLDPVDPLRGLIADAIDALTQPAQPAQQQEPVAWMYQCSADSSGPVLTQHKKDWAESGSGLWTEKPLYTSPPKREPEPVAWMVYTLDGKSVCVTDNPTDFTPEHRALPLYTSPPKREPLTDDEIADLWRAQIFHIVDLKLAKDFVRDIEAAHGIKGKA